MGLTRRHRDPCRPRVLCQLADSLLAGVRGNLDVIAWRPGSTFDPLTPRPCLNLGRPHFIGGSRQRRPQRALGVLFVAPMARPTAWNRLRLIGCVRSK